MCFCNVFGDEQKRFLDVRLPKSIEETSKISENNESVWLRTQLTITGHCLAS